MQLIQLKLADHGSCLSAEELSSASRLDRRLNEVHQEKKRVDLNLLWMQRDSEHAALLRLLENPALADVHAKLSRLKSQSGDDVRMDTHTHIYMCTINLSCVFPTSVLFHGCMLRIRAHLRSVVIFHFRRKIIQ